MTYCETCRLDNDWPIGAIMALGECVSCETFTICNDVSDDLIDDEEDD